MYKIGDILKTTKGIGILGQIWNLNENVTVYYIHLLHEDRVVHVFFGEILGLY